MKVVDAGVIVDLLVHDLSPDVLGGEELAAPHLIDSEVVHVLRRLVRGGRVSEPDGGFALDVFMAMDLRRCAADWLRPRMWELRDNLSAYDATYVALAERTGASALLTTDVRLANAPGVRCLVQVV